MKTIPSDSEISEAVQSLFLATAHLDLMDCWNTLEPTDPDYANALPKGNCLVTFVPSYMSLELDKFVYFFDGLLEADAQPIDVENEIRVKLLIYCHIMESDLLLAIIWNQLRLLNDQKPFWKFTKKTHQGKAVVCEYPDQKIQEIKTLAKKAKQPIGGVVNLIWNRDLRNAFSHSGYWISPSFFYASKNISPISRSDAAASSNSRMPRPNNKREQFGFDEIRERYRSAKSLRSAVTFEYEKARQAWNKERRSALLTNSPTLSA